MTGRERKAINQNFFNSYVWKPALAATGVIDPMEESAPVGHAHGSRPALRSPPGDGSVGQLFLDVFGNLGDAGREGADLDQRFLRDADVPVQGRLGVWRTQPGECHKKDGHAPNEKAGPKGESRDHGRACYCGDATHAE
ncbi:hypothetical protein [Streptomyces sp. NPDC006879]|uniref:hypothetical protein n=1 Tax=Streptomyces sp. NPDC006879 TaxID=3364767 RepID=UPI0036B96AC9